MRVLTRMVVFWGDRETTEINFYSLRRASRLPVWTCSGAEGHDKQPAAPSHSSPWATLIQILQTATWGANSPVISVSASLPGSVRNLTAKTGWLDNKKKDVSNFFLIIASDPTFTDMPPESILERSHHCNTGGGLSA
ncbi:hypothetical protein JOB18_016901 [Solea senegalensis]|uniref:Uncharacterized protein n=1 Tax=Solea senegalensis TaxID=28829 RepID=A0AAV6S5Q7_SOLSE|nr:hypothetical protein JOB18_016901 [Solea senegalensis]